MSCYHPVAAWRCSKAPGSAQVLVFKENSTKGFNLVDRLDLPCGRCVGCKLAKSREWATRIHHEQSLYENNCFLTLTYSPEHVPKDYRLVKDDLQKFMKRLRYYFKNEIAGKIRYYGVGEYGDNYGRPHYHICVFNLDFPDKEYHGKSKTGFPIYTSPTLEKVWSKKEKGKPRQKLGFAYVQELTFENAAYAARYVMKKQNGSMSRKRVPLYTDLETGEVIHDVQEFALMSRNPGIGKPWLLKYHKDVYPFDEVVINEKKNRPPRYYDDIYRNEIDEEGFKAVEEKRYVESCSKNRLDNRRPNRLLIREAIHKRKAKRLIRSID